MISRCVFRRGTRWMLFLAAVYKGRMGRRGWVRGGLDSHNKPFLFPICDRDNNPCSGHKTEGNQNICSASSKHLGKPCTSRMEDIKCEHYLRRIVFSECKSGPTSIALYRNCTIGLCGRRVSGAPPCRRRLGVWCTSTSAHPASLHRTTSAENSAPSRQCVLATVRLFVGK